MTEEELQTRIDELEAQIRPLVDEQRKLKRKLAAIKAGKASGKVRQAKADELEKKVLASLDLHKDSYWKKNGGQFGLTAKDCGITRQAVYQILERYWRK